ncbi:D-alanyl-D-alanine carboxypeptidase [Francisella tularensis]|uniref:D-alanyl-D-alanine carboxypeptidase n=1 Tax=Francisella tularensis TaxID=263 RepID=UPI0016802D50|nr:D-alanyl-D-alanine carboxypeptidase [Francisella tularensis]MBD2809226.1 D-alanyl-D-alanine carboxypeptidase [Francisella tularensis]
MEEIHKTKNFTQQLQKMSLTADNVYAQTITIAIGYYYNQICSILSSKNAIIKILNTKLNLYTDSIQIVDGADMSENNLLSAYYIVRLLQKILLNKNFVLFT